MDDFKTRMMATAAKAALSKALKDGKVDAKPALKRLLEAVNDSDPDTWDFRDVTCEAAKRRFEDMIVGTEIVFQDREGGWHSIIFA